MENLLRFDVVHQQRVRVSVSANVGWLDFAHGITFASPVRQHCLRFPELWPEGLLQLSCFVGRNAAFTDAELDIEPWLPVNDRERLESLLPMVQDHGLAEYILLVHWLKLLLAVREETAGLAEDEATLLVAGLDRFLLSPT